MEVLPIEGYYGIAFGYSCRRSCNSCPNDSNGKNNRRHLKLIALSAGKFGDVGQALLAGNTSLAQELAQEWVALFPGRFYLELMRTGRIDDEKSVQLTLQLAEKLQLPVVATNDVRFLESDEFEGHEARVCITINLSMNKL